MKKTIRDWIYSHFPVLMSIINFCRLLNRRFPSPKDFGSFAHNSHVEAPVMIESPKGVYLAENARIRRGTTIINTPSEKVMVGKYSVISTNCTIITNNHRSTVTIPQSLLGMSHINDKSTDIIIEEDVWVGAGAYLLAGCSLGRGCVVGAGAIVTKPVPPYAVVAGVPARIIAKKFELDDIIRHEEALYPEESRMSREELQRLFSEKYNDLNTFGSDRPLTDKEQALLEEIKLSMNFSN